MRKAILVLMLTMLSFAANAKWIGGVGYYNLSDDQGSSDISLGALAGSIGYRFESDSNFSLMPEFRLGIGVGDDRLFGAKVEVNSLIAFSVRGQIDLNPEVYLFAAPSYARLDLKASGFGSSASADDTEFGIGGGVGFHFTDKVMGEISYEAYDDTDVFGFALKIAFR